MHDIRFSTDADTLEPYLRDESSFTGHADGLAVLDDARDVEAIASLLRDASASGRAVTFSARRTSLTGAAVPEGGLVVAIPALAGPEHVTVDTSRGRATAPASVFMADVADAAERAGLFFPPDPTSRKTCSLGGAVACNASGARSFRYGPTGAFVEGLTVVLATGDILRLERGAHPPVDGHFVLSLARGPVRIPVPEARPTGIKNALGYATFDPPDVIDLFIGSEGTLGYIAEATLRLLPGVEVFAALALFPSEATALDFVAALQSETPPHGVRPMSVEWFDRRALALAAARYPRLGVPDEAVSGLLLEEAHPPGDGEAVMEHWYTALIEAGVPDAPAWLRVPTSHAQHEALRDFRHAVPESVNALARQRGLRKLGTDLAWPRPMLHRMAALYHEVLADLPAAVGPEVCADFLARHGRPFPKTLDTATFGHVGDSHLHVNLLPADPVEMAAGKIVYDHLSRLCAAAGGAISGEHGIGKAKRPMLAETTPTGRLATMRAIKHALDPAGILCRGNILDAGTKVDDRSGR
jgi:D-lactate dehydrogenase (cytochrome)